MVKNMKCVNKFDKFKDGHLLESHRIQSFKEWPFDMVASCSVEKMAEAGFYWCGNEVEKDTVTCFLCDKTLDGWEANDEPWKEHEKHAPQCMFVKYGRKESDLTLEEFIIVFREFSKNQMLKIMKQKKRDLKTEANKLLEKFTPS